MQSSLKDKWTYHTSFPSIHFLKSHTICFTFLFSLSGAIPLPTWGVCWSKCPAYLEWRSGQLGSRCGIMGQASPCNASQIFHWSTCNGRRWYKCLGSCHPCWRPGRSSWLLHLTWPNLGWCTHLGRISLCLCKSSFQMNKFFWKKKKKWASDPGPSN